MRRLTVLSFLAVACSLLNAAPASPCDYKLNLFNHRLEGTTKLRLYVEMQSANPLSSGKFEVDAAKLDTVHNPGDGIIVGAGKYQQMGNGLSTVLMLDRSKSMRQMQANERDAAIQYIDSMDSQDEVALYFFAQTASVHDFSDQPGQLRNTVHKEMPGAKPKPLEGSFTPLYEHLLKAIDKAADEASRELAFVLVMTDGQEEVGGYNADDVIKRALEKRVAVFAVGFYHVWKENGKQRNNAKELQILEKIATSTGGRYIYADAADKLGDIFVYARSRARNFLVLDTTLCGVTREQAAQNPRMNVQVRYEDCQSNLHAVPLPNLEADLPVCPQCRADADCQPNEKCNAQARCETLPCSGCQVAREHACATPSCGGDSECAAGCVCNAGACAEKPPCGECEVYNNQTGQCEGKPCQADADLPDQQKYECCKGRCAPRRECPAWMVKEAGTCSCLSIRCWHDGQCPDGIPCDGEYCADNGGQPVKRADCKESKKSFNGKCQTVKCEENGNCMTEGSADKWVCAPTIGLNRDGAEDKSCQLLRKGPCEPCEEEVDGDCRLVQCKTDGDCSDDCGCDDQSGECTDCGLCCKNPLICGGIAAFAALAIIFLILALRRRKNDDEPESLVATTPPAELSDKGATMMQSAEPPAGSGTRAERPEPAGRPAGGGTSYDQRASAPSPFLLDIDIQGRKESRPLPFGLTTVGREQGSIVIPHDIVSSNHLQIELRDNGIFVTDLGSTNGTFLTDAALHPTRMSSSISTRS